MRVECFLDLDWRDGRKRDWICPGSFEFIDWWISETVPIGLMAHIKKASRQPFLWISCIITILWYVLSRTAWVFCQKASLDSFVGFLQRKSRMQQPKIDADSRPPRDQVSKPSLMVIQSVYDPNSYLQNMDNDRL